MCKTSLLFAPQAGLSVFILAVPLPVYTPTKPLIPLYFIYKTVLIPTLKYLFIF